MNKKNLVATLLSGTMLFSMTPSEFIVLTQAAEGTDGQGQSKTDFDKNLLYEVTSTIDAKKENSNETLNSGMDLRSAKEIVVFDLGTVNVGSTPQSFSLTFKLKQDAKETAGIKYPVLTCSSETNDFTMAWSDISKGGTLDETNRENGVVLNITPKQGQSIGDHNDGLVIMDQSQRVGWPIRIKYTVQRVKQTVKPETEHVKFFGQTITPKDISYSINGKIEGTLDQLGVKELSGTGFDKDAVAGGDYSISYSAIDHGNYSYSFDGNTKIKVEKAKPVLDEISVMYSGPNETLSDYSVEEVFKNPYTGEKVDGTFVWDEPGKIVDSGTNEYSFTFNPSDHQNYEAYTGTAFVTKDGAHSSQQGKEPTTFTIINNSLIKPYKP